jgi:hypothetical protein
MRRVAGCLVVALLASAAAWGGCRGDLMDASQLAIAGSGTDGGFGGDAYGGGLPGSDAGVIVADTGEGGLPDAAVADTGSGSGEGGVPDAAVVDTGSGSGEGGVPDAAVADTGSGSGSGDGAVDDAGALDDGGSAARGDARRGPDVPALDRTSFYACAGGPASAGLEVGLPIAVALAFAVRRRRRWPGTGARGAR